MLMIFGSSVQSLGCRFFGHVFLVYVLPEGGTLTIISKDHGNSIGTFMYICYHYHPDECGAVNLLQS